MAELVKASRVMVDYGWRSGRRSLPGTRAQGSPHQRAGDEYSLWSRDPKERTVAWRRRNQRLGVTRFVPYSPLGRGFLTGALKSPDDFAADDYRHVSAHVFRENFCEELAVGTASAGIGRRKRRDSRPIGVGLGAGAG